MFSQYFGQYLLNHKLISREQLTDALEYMKSVHVKFGVMAIDEGFMTSEQVEHVHEKQKQVDKRFGELAVELGYLTEANVEALISKQKQHHLFLAQALVDRNYMSIEQFGAALANYKNEYSLSDDQFEEMKNGNIESFVKTILSDNQSSENEYYEKYLSLFVKNMIRFIDDQVFLELSTEEESQEEKWLVHQNIVGEFPLFTAISVNKELLLYIASKNAEEELTEVDELAEASISEFLNLHNGIFLVNMSNEGIELNMNPQGIDKSVTVNGDVLSINVHTTRGSFELLVSNKPDSMKLETKDENGAVIL